MSDNLIGATTAIFIVSLSIAVAEPVDVAWSTRDGTAKAGTDYQAANGVVTFLPGETEKQIEVIVYGQNVSPTSDKNFFINLMPPTNAVLGTALIEAVIKVEDESGVPVTSVIVAQGKRGLKGDPGLSAYDQAVLMGYEGTVEDWMQEQADAAAAAQRASDYAANAASAATKAENAATAASFLGNIFPTPEAGVDPVTGVGNGAYYNVRSPDDDSYLVEYQNVGGVPTPSGKSYPSASAITNIQHNNLKDRDVAGAHPASAIGYGSIDQQRYNDGLESIDEMLALSNPQDEMRVYVKSYIAGNSIGGGEFVYDASSTETANNVTIFGTGTGRWKRPASDVITPYHAGAVTSQDSIEALERFGEAFRLSGGKDQYLVVGSFKISRPWNFVMKSGGELSWALMLETTQAMKYAVALRGTGMSHSGKLAVIGQGSAANYDSFTLDYGIVINGCQSSTLPEFSVQKTKYFGVVTDEGNTISNIPLGGLSYANNTMIDTPAIFTRDTGCSTFGLSRNKTISTTFSDPVHTGSAGSYSQLTTVSLSDNVILESELIVGDFYAVINDKTYQVKEINNTNKTVSLFPWLDTTEPTSGSINFFWGGSLKVIGSNSGPLRVEKLDAIRGGIGILDGGLYGSIFTDVVVQFVCVGHIIGISPTNVGPQSTSVIGFYTEANYRNVILISGGSAQYLNRLGGFAGDAFIKCEKLIVNGRSGDGGAFQDGPGWKRVFMPTQNDNGLDGIYYKGKAKNKLLLGSTISVSNRDVVPRIYKKNSWTVALQYNDQLNITKGLDDAFVGFIGTGANAAPTGAFTFNPPSGWTVNGGASAVFSGFSGPALFMCYWDVEAKNVSVSQTTQKIAAQADSAAADVASLKSDFNALLAKMRAAGLM